MLKSVLKHSLLALIITASHAQTGPARISGGVAAGNLLTKAAPVYPPIARAAHVSGSVVLHAIIGKDGHIENLTVVSGPAMLQASALDAVRQWTYKPYLLNGNPTEVETQIVVNYNLAPDPAPAQQPTFSDVRETANLDTNALIARANAGDAVAAYSLGTRFASGSHNVIKDQPRAESLFQSAAAAIQPAAEKGDPIAQYMMGTMSHYGRGVPKSDTGATAWYRKSADQNYPPALATLANFYEYALGGLAFDGDKARTYWQKAAETGDAIVMSTYAGRLENSSAAITKNLPEAFTWYSKAADKGNNNAEDALGRFYETGTVVPVDMAQAIAWYQRAADHGNPSAQVALGVIYLQAKSVPQDNAKAFHYFELSANQDFPFGDEWLGNMYRDGITVPRNFDKARSLYTQALDRDKDNATKLLNDLNNLQAQQAATRPVDTPPANTQAAAPQQPAYDSIHNGDPNSKVRLGHGNLVYRDPTMAALDLATIQQRAANKDDHEAQFELGVRMVLGEGIKKDKKAGTKVLNDCAYSSSRCAIASGDLDGITYCNLEPKEPCWGYYKRAIQSSNEYFAAVGHDHLYSRVGGGGEALLGGIVSGLTAFNQAAGNSDGSASIQNAANQQTAAIQAKQQQAAAAQAAQAKAVAAQQASAQQQAAAQAAHQRATQLQAQQEAQQRAAQQAAAAKAEQERLASANACHGMNSIVHLQSEWFPYGPKENNEVVGYFTNNSTVNVTCTWAFHKNGQWTEVGTGYIKVGATHQGGQGGGIWTMGADSSDMRYACFEGSDPVGPDGKHCATEVVFSGPTSAGTDLRDRK